MSVEKPAKSARTAKPAGEIDERAAGSAEVDAFVQKLEHPMKPELEALRAIFLGASSRIVEGIKWNSPSFRVREYFGTVNLRGNALQVILHQGAKATAASTTGLDIDDPAGLLEWLGKERASVKFTDLAGIKKNKKAFQAILHQWVDRLPE
ncbi:MAG: DUF1801 domain-containing protein [Betaproteobacteria bacterium]